MSNSLDFRGLSEREADALLKTTRAEKYGRRYYGVRLIVADDPYATAYFMADEIRFNAGCLEVWCAFQRQDKTTEAPQLMHMFPPGTWREAFAASCFDSTPMAICDDDRLWPKPDKRAQGGQKTSNEQKARRKAMARERGKVTPRLRWQVFTRDNFSCVACGAKGNTGVLLHVDHKVAVSNGGETHPDNLQTLCEACNFGKGAE